MCISTLALLCASALAAQTSTGGLLNGRLWVSISLPASRLGFLTGFLDGLTAGIQTMDGCSVEQLEKAKNIFPAKAILPIDELVQSLDSFYKDAANRPIPIARALLYIHARARGTPPATCRQAHAFPAILTSYTRKT
jgi:hypothetical protein